MVAIMQTAKENLDVLQTLKLHIGMGLAGNSTEDKSMDIQIRIAEIDAEFQAVLKTISSDVSIDSFDDTKIAELLTEKHSLEQQLEQYADIRQRQENSKSRLHEIGTILDGLKNHPLTYDDQLVRQIIECIIVESKEKIKIVFTGGYEMQKELNGKFWNGSVAAQLSIFYNISRNTYFAPYNFIVKKEMRAHENPNFYKIFTQFVEIGWQQKIYIVCKIWESDIFNVR